jgi:hypothetical protein
MEMEHIYKSPKHKLLKFFERSRDRWKEKALEAKNNVKLCKNRIKFLEMSKANLKAEVKNLKAELNRDENKKKRQQEP